MRGFSESELAAFKVAHSIILKNAGTIDQNPPPAHEIIRLRRKRERLDRERTLKQIRWNLSNGFGLPSDHYVRENPYNR